jgi:hypothetical protein
MVSLARTEEKILAMEENHRPQNPKTPNILKIYLMFLF